MAVQADSDRSSRMAVIDSIKAALGMKSVIHDAALAGVATPGAPGTPLPVQGRPDLSTADLFEEVLLDYRATVRRCEENQVANVIAELFSDQDISSVVVPRGLDSRWYARLGGIDLTVDDGARPAVELASIDAVITGCACAIAETGTIVLSCQPDEGRRAITLLPDFHFCVVKSEVIIRHVKDLFKHVSIANPITLISGPSATSDIELKRVEGVHGPRHLFVIIVS